MLYTIVLSVHSILRWLVVLFGIYAIVRFYFSWSRQADWSDKDNRISLLYTIFLDIQVLVGIILYLFISPITTAALQNISGITDPTAQFFTINHVTVMVVAAVAAHLGRFLATRISYGIGPFKHAATWFALSMLFVFVSVPWPFMPISRPLLRLFGLTF